MSTYSFTRLDRILGSLPIRIPRGPLRGFRWLPSSGGKVLRVFGGSYEQVQTSAMLGQLRPSHTFFDVGAHVGWYTLLASRLVGHAGNVVGFEPSPRNFAFLARHVELNALGNVRLVEAAVADQEGTGTFQLGGGSGTGHLAFDGPIEVATTTLDGFVARTSLVPDVLKIDVEGGELAVLEGAKLCLRDHRPSIFLSTHGDDMRAQCTASLLDAGYRVVPLQGEADSATEFLCTPLESYG